MRLTYVREKLGRATRELMVGAGTIQERSKSAYMAAHTLQPADFPDYDSRDLWLDITDALTSAQAQGNEGRLLATLRQMDDKKASEIAGKFDDLNDMVRRFGK